MPPSPDWDVSEAEVWELLPEPPQAASMEPSIVADRTAAKSFFIFIAFFLQFVFIFLVSFGKDFATRDKSQSYFRWGINAPITLRIVATPNTTEKAMAKTGFPPKKGTPVSTSAKG